MHTTSSIKPLVLVNKGAKHTLIDKPGQQYDGISAQEIANLVAKPQCVDKENALFIIPSEYRFHDGRSHETQRALGSFRYLCFDIDTGNHMLRAIEDAFSGVFPNTGMMIYSSAGASKSNKKWRVIVPLLSPILGSEYTDATLAAINMLAIRGIECDHALTRCGQPVYLPNVPADKRDEDGRPLFYQYNIIKKQPYDYEGSELEAAVRQAIIAREEAEYKAKIEREQRAAKRALARASLKDQFDPVEEFNAKHTIADLFIQHGYQKLGGSNQYRSPNQSSGSYAVADFGEYWVSHSGSDVALGIGQVKDGYCWGDAFDLYCYYEHGGDMTKAVREYSAELRGPEFEPVSHALDDFQELPQIQDDIPEDHFDINAEIPDTGLQPPEPQTWPTPLDQFDSSILPKRRWIYGYDYIRGYVSVLASAGGIGKTSLIVAEGLSIATGKQLLETTVKEQTNVWIINLEDPRAELELRLLAAMRHYKIEPEEVRGKLFVDGEDTFQMILASENRDGLHTNDPLLAAIKEKVEAHNIGVVVIDPWVSASHVNENSNTSVQAVVAMVRELARDTNSSVMLVHHVRKGNGDDATIDSVRGAGALIGAARAARVINRVSEEEAAKVGVNDKEAKGLFSIIDGKANLAPSLDKRLYRKMIGVKIDNDEYIGVAVPYRLPDAFDGISGKDARRVQDIVGMAEKGDDPLRADIRAKNWVGYAIGDALGINASEKAGKTRLNTIIKTWLNKDVLRVETLHSKRDGRDVSCITVGKWINWDEVD